MKHYILKYIIIALILTMGANDAWATKYYFEVPDHWTKNDNTIFALRLFDNTRTAKAWASNSLKKINDNTYCFDNSYETPYSYLQFCRMKDDIIDTNNDSWHQLGNAEYYTEIIEFSNDKRLLKVNPKNTSNQYVAYWDQFSVNNIHILLDHNVFFKPQLLIGNDTGSRTYDMNKINNAFNRSLFHLFIDHEIVYKKYAIVDARVGELGYDNMSFDERFSLYQNYTSSDITELTCTQVYQEPIISHAIHRYTKTDDSSDEDKIYLNGIQDLNASITVDVLVSYDGGQNYITPEVLPANIYAETYSFGDDWERLDQHHVIDLKKWGTVTNAVSEYGFSYWTQFICTDYNPKKYKLEWIVNGGTPSTTNPKDHRYTNIKQKELTVIARLTKIGDWDHCNVTFNTDYLINSSVPNWEQSVALFGTVSKPEQLDCKWYIDADCTTEFDFSTPINNDLVLYAYKQNDIATGSFRLLYVEQVVEKNATKQTVITRKKAHPSDIIAPQSNSSKIVSLHVYRDNEYQAVEKYIDGEPQYYTSPSNSEVILQTYNGTDWINISHHMVFDRLAMLPFSALLPGRRNLEEDLLGQLIDDDGIETIKNDPQNDGNGVWNFTVTQDSEGNAYIDFSKLRRYSEEIDGPYYIRTANAPGGWQAYKENPMTFSEYQKTLGAGNEEFTHYYCKRVEFDKDSKLVHFAVANTYAQAVSDTLVADSLQKVTRDGVYSASHRKKFVFENGELSDDNVNIRFSWKEENNALHRAYISHAEVDKNQFLLLKDKQGDKLFDLSKDANGNLVDLANNQQLFTYNDHNRYQTNLRAKPNAPVKLTATYSGKTQDIKGGTNTVLLYTGNEGDNNAYPIHVLYHFGENQLTTSYLPLGEEYADQKVDIETDVMIVRKNHEQANQLLLTNNARTINTGETAYGALSFTHEHLSSNGWEVTNDKTFYWISFPFDVNLSEAFGFGKYAVHWYIEWYDGENRAKNGLFLDSGTYWKYVTKKEAATFVLEANKGYVLWLNVPRIQSDGLLNNYNAQEITLFFPAREKIKGEFSSQQTTVNLPAYWRPEERRKAEDSNWHLIGVPSYANTKMTTEPTEENGFKFLYDYIPASDTYAATYAEELTFQSMYAYMVQHYGDISWLTAIKDHVPAAIAARRNSSEGEKKMLRLELHRNGTCQDRTYIGLENEEATAAFDMNKDLTKVINKTPNIYSITSDNVDVAGNIMPLAESIVSLGVDLQAAGEYTFAMPDGTEGMVVELIDYENNTRTNLLLDSYSVNLAAGANETRFALHIQPDKVATSVEEIGEEAKGDKAKKYIIDGNLYMQQGDVVYDAQGHIVR